MQTVWLLTITMHGGSRRYQLVTSEPSDAELLLWAVHQLEAFEYKVRCVRNFALTGAGIIFVVEMNNKSREHFSGQFEAQRIELNLLETLPIEAYLTNKYPHTRKVAQLLEKGFDITKPLL